MKKLNAKSLKQGQTIYLIVFNPHWITKKHMFKVRKDMLYSNKEPLPPEGCVIDKVTVNIAKSYIKTWGTSKGMFYSRRKANSMVKLLNR